MDHRKILYLHIGMPKTGTSSLQVFLMQNEEALAQYGVAYPMMPGRYPMISPSRNAHFLIGKLTDEQGREDPAQTENMIKKSFELLDQTFKKADKVILSDEAIWNVYKPDKPDCLRLIRTFCEERNIEIKLIVYLRRQDYYLESYWKQQIRKRGVTWTWKKMVKKTPKYIVLNYYEHLKELAEEIGRKNMIVQSYHEENFDLCVEFLHLLGIRHTEIFQPLETKANLSLNNNYAEIKRILNRILSEDPEQWGREQKWLGKIVVDCSREEKRQYESSMFSTEDRQKYMENFREINHRIAQEYLGCEDLFEENEEKNRTLPKWTPDNSFQYEDTVLFFGKALLDMKRELELQRAEVKQLETGKRGVVRKVVDKCRTIVR